MQPYKEQERCFQKRVESEWRNIQRQKAASAVETKLLNHQEVLRNGKSNFELVPEVNRV